MTKEEIQMSLYVCEVLYYAKNLKVKQTVNIISSLSKKKKH